MDAWQIVENSAALARPVASGFRGQVATIHRQQLWEMFHDHANAAQADK
jgi:hypothetical protein